MSYKKYMKKVSFKTGESKLGTTNNSVSSIYNKLKNYLPLLYKGPDNRIDRYTIYDGMDQDPIISTALDVQAEYIAQIINGNPFYINYSNKDQIPESQITTLEKQLDNWVKLNDWRKRLFNVIRDVMKYGDCIFVRDIETNVLQKCNISDVLGVIANEKNEIKYYLIKNIQQNIPLKTANSALSDTKTSALINTYGGSVSNSGNILVSQGNISPLVNNKGAVGDKDLIVIPASNIMHLSLNIDNVLTYPFGISSLEPVYKIYIQKMLLQDCILLYRIKNASEKLIFNIPVGNIPRSMRLAYLEKCKNELFQKRTPTKDSDGVFNTIDVAYSALPINEDFFLPVDSDGVQPKIEKLASGACLSLDTKIKLLDGRDLSLTDIINEYNNGKKLWAYSCNPLTGEVLPGEITWAGITRQNTDALKITLEDDEEIICTPDHKFPIYNKGKMKAEDLKKGYKIISIGLRNNGNEEIYNPKNNKWELTEDVMGKFVKEDISTKNYLRTLYHKDGNYNNNSIDNLMWVDNSDTIFNHLKIKFHIFLNNIKEKNSYLLFRKLYEMQGNFLKNYYKKYNTTRNIKDYDYNKNDKHNLNKNIGYKKIKKIEVLPYKIDAGTITIDGMEMIHPYHTFVLSNGVFTYNSLGEINDLVYWENSLIRGLKVPQSWISYGPQDNERVISNNTTNTFVQEERFYQFCKRIQNTIIDALDSEFKLFNSKSGINVDNDSFILSLNDPSNITQISNRELKSSKISLCKEALGIPYLSKQFVLKHYLELSEEEFKENEILLKIENQEKLKAIDSKLTIENTSAVPGLRSVDISDIPQEIYNQTSNVLNNSNDTSGGMPMAGAGNIGMNGLEAPMGEMGSTETQEIPQSNGL